jgi:predicted DNA-binding transcriptional regulator YafY
MKSERLLTALLLLQSKGRMSARELARELEVSERTIYRDLDALSAAGIPVYAERGARGGIRLSDGYRAALTQLGEEEVRALFVSAADPLADLGMGGSLRRTLAKLAGALPESKRKTAERARGRIHVDPRRWRHPEQPREHLAVLQRALWDDRCVNLHYRDGSGKETTRRIEPLGLVAKAGVWYVVARSGADMRVFRAERIIAADELSERFTRPAGFDLERYWNEWTTDFESRPAGYLVTLRVATRPGPRPPGAVVDLLETLTFLEAKLDRDAQTARVAFSGIGPAIANVMLLGAQVEVIEPVELREQIVRTADELLAHYRARSASAGRA